MVEAIRSVRERTKSTVDMRVGVHTGGVLAGVLGQRQWQFDVYSKDVELANKMESSGLPGRVHISNATLRFLNDEFEVTEGHGASREEALRLANIKTYFIDRVKKPVSDLIEAGCCCCCCRFCFRLPSCSERAHSAGLARLSIIISQFSEAH